MSVFGAHQKQIRLAGFQEVLSEVSGVESPHQRRPADAVAVAEHFHLYVGGLGVRLSRFRRGPSCVVINYLISEQRRRSDLAVTAPRKRDGRVCVVDDDRRARGAGKRRRVGRPEKPDVWIFRRFHFQLGTPRGFAVDRRRHARVNAVVAFLQIYTETNSVPNKYYPARA